MTPPCFPKCCRSHLRWSPQFFDIRLLPSQIARQAIPDLFSCRIRFSVEQIDRSQNHSRSAKTTLNCPMLDKSALNRMQRIAACEPLYGYNVSALKLSR